MHDVPDPCKLAADFSGPVMIIAGSADTQVSPDRDAKALDAALSGRKGDVHMLTIIPKASHNLKIPSNATDAGFERSLTSPLRWISCEDRVRKAVAALMLSTARIRPSAAIIIDTRRDLA